MAIKREACDENFSNAVRLRDGWRCTHCGRCEGRLDCAHIYGRRHKSVRWSMDNAIALCFTCHKDFTANPLDFTRWLESYLGSGHLAILKEKKNAIMKTTAAMRKEIAAHYRAEVKRKQLDETYQIISWN